jgi:signal transduction histidine kinase
MPLDGSGGEFDRLSLVLNRMLDRIGALLDNLRQVSGDIAHDLRTPLYRIRAQLERAEEKLANSPQQKVVTAAIQEMDGLLDLFSALLAISEIEGQSIRKRFVMLDLAETVEELVEAYKPAIEQAGMTIEVVARPTEVFGDRKLLQRAVANLLDNVLIHTRAGTSIRITIDKAADEIILTFADDGPGIPAADHERVFHRLTRLDRSRSTPGHGLGMNIVAAITAAHGGSVEIMPDTPGLAVRLILK